MALIDVRDGSGKLLLRYDPEMRIIELADHYYDNTARRRRKRWILIKLTSEGASLIETLPMSIRMKDHIA